MQKKSESPKEGPDRQNKENKPESQEKEFIVLNRQEDEAEVSKKLQNNVEANWKLAQYEYFDWKEIYKSMRVTQAIVKKGEALYQNNVISLDDVDCGYMEGRSDVIGEAYGSVGEGRTAFPMRLVFDRTSSLYAECACPEC